MLQDVDYVIYYEHIAREFESVKNLKEKLDLLGFNGVVLPIHFNRYSNIIKYKPKLVILPFFYSRKTVIADLYDRLYLNVKFLNLHSEQIFDETTKYFQQPQDDFSVNSYHISWGERFANLLIESGVKKDLIFKSGSIRNDSVISNKGNTSYCYYCCYLLVQISLLKHDRHVLDDASPTGERCVETSQVCHVSACLEGLWEPLGLLRRKGFTPLFGIRLLGYLLL